MKQVDPVRGGEKSILSTEEGEEVKGEEAGEE